MGYNYSRKLDTTIGVIWGSGNPKFCFGIRHRRHLPLPKGFGIIPEERLCQRH